MKQYFFLFFLMISIGYFPCLAQNNVKTESKTGYEEVIKSRAEKIVATLGISDSVKFKKVTGIIAGQYRNLNEIYTLRDAQIKVVKMQLNGNNDGLKESVTLIQNRSDSAVKALHPKFLKALSKEITKDQIDLVKDGMTYNVLHVTYNGYTQMILNLTDAQKKQIMVWLVEAREYAMDGESSEKKHAWFGKYKGRINNYLSAAGYDLKKEGVEWEKRRNAVAK